MSEAPRLPPLFGAAEAGPGRTPLADAMAQAALGCDAGLTVWSADAQHLSAAVVLAPEVPLADAVAMLPVAGIGVQNALGALAPPEVAVHLDWDGAVRVNGARAGRLSMAASTRDAQAVPDWLIVALDMALTAEGRDPGTDPDTTALSEEGCVEVTAVALIEAWVRHMLVWITRWEEGGGRAVHADWLPLVHGVGEDAAQDGRSGTFVGVDERFGMLLRDGDGTHLIPMTTLLKDPAP
ncbi:DUF4444 domain-containing protein [Rhodobacteraceae bacterium CCMM004]|nr:DUF4444 domain-containing protein [Rhodobacteraceae bacterium CCMM004]